MRIQTLTALLAVLLGGQTVARAQAPAKDDRFDRFNRFEPGLIVETGARMGACDVVTFTPDGDYLMAVGDDKVVRIWRRTDQGLDPNSLQVLRWSIFRENRGNIYALALSPERDKRLVAVGGLGVQSGGGSVALLDRDSGEVKKAMIDPQATSHAIWAVAFSPSGQRIAYGRGDGQVNVWDPRAAHGKDILRLGKHVRKDGGLSNKVRLVAFLGEDKLLSVAEDGQLLQWSLADPQAAPRPMHQFSGRHLWQARISPDQRSIGVISQHDTDKIEVLSLFDMRSQKFELLKGTWPSCLALDAKGERLAVSVFISSAATANGTTQASRAQVYLYDLRQPRPTPVPGPSQTYFMDALAFHPNGQELAVAGGADHEVTLWDLARLAAPKGEKILGPGRCLWGVTVSKDGKYLAFQDQVNTQDPPVNQRGQGPWRIFDLHKRGWAPTALKVKDIDPVLPKEQSAKGWSILKGADAYTWFVLAPGAERPAPPATTFTEANNKDRWVLPLSRTDDAYPRCFTFLDGTPPRLAVGHFWGVSIFELTAKGPQRTRVMYGHQGEVMSLTTSADQKLLFTAGRDQTIAAWSLASWDNHPELGASFLLAGGKITVQDVAPGSPAWEIGLTKNDEVLVLAFGRDELYDPDNIEPKERRARAAKIINANQCLDRLKNPVPGREFFFQLKRAGRPQPVTTLTRVLQRPLWRFFPMRNNEWVLWQWRDYYYDCSTNGDRYIGWQVNGDVDVTPSFYKAEQFRHEFYKPEKVEALLKNQHKPEKVAIPDIEPPEVRLDVSTRTVTNEDLVVNLTALARGKRENHQLDRVLLWINDFKFTLPEADKKVNPFVYRNKVVIPRDQLRRGRNQITFQCYNHADIRGEALPVIVTCERPRTPPKLFGLFIGVGDYSRAKRRLADLNADRDAEAMHEAWTEQKAKGFQDAELELLINRDVSRDAVLKKLAALRGKVKPDDQLLLFIGGHGTSDVQLNKLAEALKQKILNPLPPRSFAFVGPQFDHLNPNNTCLTSKDVYDAVAQLPCRKLVLLDACHSGTIAVNPVRDLTRDGVGPVILTACQPNEQAIEFGLLDNNRAYGLFTMAVRRALEEEFDDADADHNRELKMTELVNFIRVRVPRLVQELRDRQIKGITKEDTQEPAAFLPTLEEEVPLAQK